MRHLGLWIALAIGCQTPDPRQEPVPSPTPAIEPTPRPGTSLAASDAAPAADAPDGGPASPAASAGPPDAGAAADAPLEPMLLDETGKPLPQTDDRPSTTSPSFERRLALVFRAIQTDDPEIALDAFFPLVAYEQVKAIEKPKADFESRLLKNYRRDIHAYHDKLGPDPDRAKLLGIEVDEKRVKWMEPGKEGNKLGYFRVTRSRIRFTNGAGEERSFELTSLISWRGEWFVVHLDGFK